MHRKQNPILFAKQVKSTYRRHHRRIMLMVTRAPAANMIMSMVTLLMIMLAPAHVTFSFKPGNDTIVHAHKRIAESAQRMDTVFNFGANEADEVGHSQRGHQRRQMHEWDINCPGGGIICDPVPWDLFGYNCGGNDRAKQHKISFFHSHKESSGTSHGFDYMYKSSGTVDFDCLDCFAHLGVGLEFELKFTTTWHGSVNFELFTLLTGKISGNMHLHAHAEAEFSATRKISILEDQHLGSFTIPLGAVPLMMSFTGGLDAQVDFDARVSGDADFAVSYTRNIMMGVQYNGSEFTDLHEMYGPGYHRSGPSYTFAGSADLKATLIPQVAAVIYSEWPIGKQCQAPPVNTCIHSTNHIIYLAHTLLTLCPKCLGKPCTLCMASEHSVLGS